MQILKDEIRSAILDSAKTEFFTKNYQLASMRTIAQNAGVTVGNLYRYFPAKELILDTLVTETEVVVDAITESIQFTPFLSQSPEAEAGMKKTLQDLSLHLGEKREEILILFNKCGGTKHGAFKENYLKRLTAELSELLSSTSAAASLDSKQIHLVAGALCSSYLSGILCLLSDTANHEELNTSLQIYISILRQGIPAFG